MANIAIVGANRGIGLALVEEYMNAGHEVYAFCRKSSKELEALKPKVITSDFEVTDLFKIHALLKDFANIKFDLLFHNSGIWGDEDLFNLEQKDFAGMTHLFEVNSIAPLKVVSEFLPLLSSNSKIALMSSQMGSISDNSSGSRYSYRMSKAALNAAGKSLAIDLKQQGISVVICHPGYVKTDMTGGNGLITTKQSAQGLVKIVDKINLENSGTFWHSNGNEILW